MTGRNTPDVETDVSSDLAAGRPGTTLLRVVGAHDGADTWATAHQHVRAMISAPIPAHPDTISLFYGAPAVAYVLHTAARPKYAHALDTLDEHVAVATRARLDAAHRRIDRNDFPALREYDLIGGLTGLGVYLLYRHGPHNRLLRDVLTYLVRLTEPRTIDGVVLPGWWSQDGPSGRPDPRWPSGHVNLGLAHGIAGPLALLALTFHRGVALEQQAEAIDRVCAFLDDWRCGTQSRTWWPGIISPAEWHAGTVRTHHPQRPSWCYGTPGLVRAQQLAALALDQPHRAPQVEAVLAACADDQDQLALLTDASLCHGWAGFLHATRRVAADAASGQLDEQLPGLELQPRHRDREANRAQNAGFLEGAAGVRLAQHADTGHAATRWDACLLLDPAKTTPQPTYEGTQ